MKLLTKKRERGQYGEYWVIQLDGKKYPDKIFNKEANRQLDNIPEGSEVYVTTEQKGKYENITSVTTAFTGQAGVDSVRTGGPETNAAPKKAYSRDPLEVNLMMLTRYALDVQLQKPDLTAFQCVQQVNEIMQETKKLLSVDPQ